MIIDKATIVIYVGTKALPAMWAWWVAHTMTKAQIVGKYCPPVTELPANMTDFQKAQYEKQCGQVGTYIFQVPAPAVPQEPSAEPAPAKPAVPVEQIGPPEPAEQKP